MAKKNTLYIDSLDGIRAVAVMLVFLAHAGLENIVPGGFGVTIFFFLSGYLITTLLRREFEKTRDISIRKFYLRRVFRIFPPLYIVLAFNICLAFLGVHPHTMKPAAVAAECFHMTNYYGLFFGTEHFVPATGILWSLAVEEHYYLIYPVSLMLLLRRFDYKRIAIIFAWLCVAILLWRCFLLFGMEVDYRYNYRATDTRLDSILFGCIMGMWANPVLDGDPVRSDRGKVFLLIGSGIVLLVCFLYRNEDFRYSLRYTLQGFALIPWFHQAIRRSNWWIFKWLNYSPIKWLGRISYTFYLSHPMGLYLSGLTTASSGITRGIVGFLYTAAFSILMYAFVEKKMAEKRRKLHIQAKAS